jgi:hypothetical protein
LLVYFSCIERIVSRIGPLRGSFNKYRSDNMATTRRSIIVGVFDDHRNADTAVNELRNAGFSEDQIGVVMRHGDDGARAAGRSPGHETYAEEGGVTGVLVGAGLGALAGLGVLSGVIPVIGPAIAGGTLGILVSNAALGAGVAGLVGVLIGWGVPEPEAKYYHGELEAGRTIVTVRVDGRTDKAWAIMQRHGAYDMNTRAALVQT